MPSDRVQQTLQSGNTFVPLPDLPVQSAAEQSAGIYQTNVFGVGIYSHQCLASPVEQSSSRLGSQCIQLSRLIGVESGM